jgi:hypothetical protein
MAMVVLVMMLAVGVIGVLGIFSFEVTRTNSARQELQHVCEAAALAAAAAMPTPFPAMNPHNSFLPTALERHDRAKTAAQQVVISNSILQTWLADVDFTDSRNSNAEQARRSNPGAGDAVIFTEFLNLDGDTMAWNWSWGEQRVHVVGAFGVQPAFGKYCGINKVVVYGDATAPIPWVQSFHADWTWLGPANTDTTDNGEFVPGTFWDPTDPKAFVSNGILNIPESPGGFMTAVQHRQRYGYFQVVGKFDSHSWAKMWLTNDKNEAVMPQIDVVSSYGGVTTSYNGIIHSSAGPGDVTNQPTLIPAGVDLSADFHSYGIMWLPRKPDVYFMIDGKVVAKVKKFNTTDQDKLQLVIGNSRDTVSNTSTGSEPPAQFLTMDSWEMNADFVPQNIIFGPK